MDEASESVGRVLYEREGHVARVTLNRPAVLNAMDLRMHAELADVWDEIERDDAVRLVVLTGAGERAFSVGQDLKERARLDRDGAEATSFGSRGLPGWPRLTERFSFAKPILARVQGYALGGGFELVLACDLVVAGQSASFALPEAALGLIPGAGGAFRLARQIPLKTAMGYLLTGRRMTAREALAHGLVNEVVPDDELDACVDRWTADLLRCAPLSQRAIKEAVMRSADMPLENAFSARYHWEAVRRASQDAKEGPRAFAEGRKPVWRGE
ncbi:enoyl-CoA hydratase/isomerase family protein [Actinospica sp. MGRD01-02]|uniref:enoyl-CoA hydratase n=1 Tax=Actinospica acidithermotolerans TaxID=2828514 RepID=A0A941EEN4_9ACTN|nr:enoyl-CoA-hydratase DpgD [Actinospica acidithermotolerans]MBR7826369.1 enoyl-CoA hydratase/isomerase family protein [Actinospica acidithermotolerans]